MSVNYRNILFLVFFYLIIQKFSAQSVSLPINEADPSSLDSIKSSILLKQDTLILDEAIIHPYKDYASFRQAFLELDCDHKVEQDMTFKSQIIRNQIKLGVNPDMDAFANYRNRYTYNLIRTNGFILFSSEPGKGIPVGPIIRKVLGKE